MKPLEVGPGDVLAVGGTGLFAWAIRLLEKIGGRPHHVNHVVIITHQDDQGRWMGIAGQPGGVGQADMTKFLTQWQTNTNHYQPRPNDNHQLELLLASCAKSLGIAYDWVGIGADMFDDLNAHDLSLALDNVWKWPTKDGQLPGHVVCSSLAAKLYAVVGWDHPTAGEERLCEPGDWWGWNQKWTKPTA